MIYRIILLSMALCFSLSTYAGCTSGIEGRSENFMVRIPTYGCGQEVIEVTKFEIDDIKNKESTMLTPFRKECKNSDTGFSCHKDGKTLLAGTTYKYTTDTNPKCPFEVVGKRLTCVSGCTKKTPKYLYEVPYC